MFSSDRSLSRIACLIPTLIFLNFESHHATRPVEDRVDHFFLKLITRLIPANGASSDFCIIFSFVIILFLRMTLILSDTAVLSDLSENLPTTGIHGRGRIRVIIFAWSAVISDADNFSRQLSTSASTFLAVALTNTSAAA
jgi:hypothetical protein